MNEYIDKIVTFYSQNIFTFVVKKLIIRYEKSIYSSKRDTGIEYYSEIVLERIRLSCIWLILNHILSMDYDTRQCLTIMKTRWSWESCFSFYLFTFRWLSSSYYQLSNTWSQTLLYHFLLPPTKLPAN